MELSEILSRIAPLCSSDIGMMSFLVKGANASRCAQSFMALNLVYRLEMV